MYFIIYKIIKMVTPILERLILSGRAELKHYASGGSAVGIIPMNAGSGLIAVVGVIWNPFTDQPASESGDIEPYMMYNIHTLKLWNRRLQQITNFRDSIQFCGTLDGVLPGRAILKFDPPQHYPMFFLSEQAIRFEITKNFDPVGTTFNTDTVPPIAGFQDFPTGYGGAPVVRSINSPTLDYSAIGLQNDPASSAGNRTKNEFWNDVDPGITTLNIPGTFGEAISYNFPLLTFQYVEINESAAKEFRG